MVGLELAVFIVDGEIESIGGHGIISLTVVNSHVGPIRHPLRRVEVEETIDGRVY